MAYDQLEEFIKNPAKKTQVDPSVLDAIQKQQAQASAAPTQGIAESLGFGNTSPKQFNAALGGPVDASDSIAKAVQSRNMSRSKDFINNLKRGIELENPLREAKAASQAGSNLGHVADMNLMNYKIQRQNQLDKQRIELYKQQQRDAILGGILGFVGTITGGVIGGKVG